MPQGENGITTKEARERLDKYGPNVLPEKKPPSDLVIFLSQLKSPLVYVLLFAGFVTLILEHFSDSLVIGFAILLNTFLGFFQERRAENALYALKKFIQAKATVIRDKKRMEIDAEGLVPGDFVIVDAGEKIPADGHLIFANRFYVNEAILTGESAPVEKQERDEVFMGTIVASGQGKFIVNETGSQTEIGKIAEDIQEKKEETPLKRQLIQFSQQLTFVVVALTLFVFISGIVIGRDIVEIFTTSVALAVSAIPEGLLVGLTVVLAIGMQKILSKKGLVRNLVSAETLGGVTTICLDKTGTLTEGEMKVLEVMGDKKDVAMQSILANDQDDPVVIALWEWAVKNLTGKNLSGENLDDFLRENKRIDSIPFSSKDRYSASLNQIKNDRVLFVNGAPEYLLEWSNLSPKEKKEIKRKIDQLTAKGRRLIALTKKKVPSKTEQIDPEKIKKDLEWIGIVALTDPVRTGVKEALLEAQKAKVKLVVITGDYAQTAAYVLSELGFDIPHERIILGAEVEKMSPSALSEKLAKLMKGNDEIVLFARTTPEQKLKIVLSLKRNREVIAMLGDGVNDAPALKNADIGVVVGTASDVAKESSDLVLLDSHFTTVVSAIEEGRGIFSNLRKIVLYLMSSAFSEILAVVASIFIGMPLPVTASQILWINLVSDGLPHLALSVDPKDKDIMKMGPRSYAEPLISNWMKKIILVVSASGGMVGFLLFVYYYTQTSDLRLAQSIAFAALGTNSLMYVFSTRALEKPIWKTNPFENQWLNIAFLAGLALQIFPFMFTNTRDFLGLSKLETVHWITIFSASITMLILIESLKIFFKKPITSNLK